jgi:hypothetical protein
MTGGGDGERVGKEMVRYGLWLVYRLLCKETGFDVSLLGVLALMCLYLVLLQGYCILASGEILGIAASQVSPTSGLRSETEVQAQFFTEEGFVGHRK